MGLIYGVGISDVDYRTSKTVNGKRVICKFYMTWRGMLQRCYDKKFLERCPRYKGCSVHKDWHRLSNFRAWMLEQDYIGKQLDKDLLIKGNKIYSADTCLFISAKLNSFITDSQTDTSHLIGVRKDGNRYKSTIANIHNGGSIHLGMFDTPEEANLAYRMVKGSQAKEIAMTLDNVTVANTLLSRYEVNCNETRGLL